MIQIRNNVFETNSSSTHSICISKEHIEPDDFISFHIGEFGWAEEEVNAADYLYTAILEQRNKEELLYKLKFILDDNSVSYEFEEPQLEHHSWGDYLENGYVDHAYDALPFINAVLNDDDMLMRFLFGNSHVYTGNDNNCYEDNPLSNSAFEDYWVNIEDENGEWHCKQMPNPNHDPEHYQYFFKGN